jgi:hypothetical protein
MRMRMGSLIKLDAVLEIALRHPAFREKLASGQAEALTEHGVSLSEDEREALRDLIEGTSRSFLTKAPEGESVNRFDLLRHKWSLCVRTSA